VRSVLTVHLAPVKFHRLSLKRSDKPAKADCQGYSKNRSVDKTPKHRHQSHQQIIQQHRRPCVYASLARLHRPAVIRPSLFSDNANRLPIDPALRRVFAVVISFDKRRGENGDQFQ